MNHNKLEDAIMITLLSIYDVLYKEYNNESKAKKEVYKIASNQLKKFGAVSDLYSTIINLTNQYKTADNLKLKKEIKAKLDVINETLKIIKEVEDGE